MHYTVAYQNNILKEKSLISFRLYNNKNKQIIQYSLVQWAFYVRAGLTARGQLQKQ
jgi:hypothetical protein